MSDHTGNSLDDWEEASLPGAAFTAGTQDSLTNNIIPRTPSQITQASQTQKRPPQGKAFLRTSQYALRNGRSQLPAAPGNLQRSGGILTRSTPTLPRPLPVENHAFAKYQRGAQSDGQYVLLSNWRLLLAHLRDPNGPSFRIARNRLDEICCITKAHIVTPADNATKIEIWGDKQQVQHAQARLELFESDIRATGTRPGQDIWAKTTAFNARFEARQEKEKQLRDTNKALRLLGQELDFDFEAHLLWPDGIDVVDFVSKYESTVLYEISEQNNCRIDLQNDGTNCIKIFGHEESELMACYLRVRNLVKDSMAHEDRLIILNQFSFPAASVYRDRVRLDRDPNTKLCLPTLHGTGLLAGETEDWNALCIAMQKRTRKNIRNSIDICIRSIKAAKKYVRMMVTFGDLGFSRYKAPPPGQDSHSFGDFCEMITEPLTRLKPYPLRAPRGNISDLVKKLVESGAFGEPTTTYGAHFDFHGRDQTTLRLETHFKLGFEGKELEMYEKRWLEFKGTIDNDLLEINVFDFERLNYQIHVGAYTLQDSRALKPSLASFESNLGLKASVHGIKAVPRRRAFFPPGLGSLARVAEITVARLSFRDTEGVFELRRQDVYDETPSKKSEMPVESIWNAAYYYPEWDNLLRDFGSLKPGEDVSWRRSIDTFFPPSRSTEDKGALPKGFRAFMKEVEEIQGLLTEAIAALPVVQVNGQ